MRGPSYQGRPLHPLIAVSATPGLDPGWRDSVIKQMSGVEEDVPENQSGAAK